jgi:hypothetical protein
VAHLAVDFDVDLAEVPLPVGVAPHVLDAALADLAGEQPEAAPPRPSIQAFSPMVATGDHQKTAELNPTDRI